TDGFSGELIDDGVWGHGDNAHGEVGVFAHEAFGARGWFVVDGRFEGAASGHEFPEAFEQDKGVVAVVHGPVGGGQEVEHVHDLVVHLNPEIFAGHGDGFVIDDTVEVHCFD